MLRTQTNTIDKSMVSDKTIQSPFTLSNTVGGTLSTLIFPNIQKSSGEYCRRTIQNTGVVNNAYIGIGFQPTLQNYSLMLANAVSGINNIEEIFSGEEIWAFCPDSGGTFIAACQYVRLEDNSNVGIITPPNQKNVP